MKFTVSEKKKHSEVEKDLIEYWKENGTFQKSIDQRPKENAWVFYDGPPFITGLPHHGNLSTSVIKDSVSRYYAMQGKRVERAWGWDCHGLPAEVFTEKKLGIKSKDEIGTKISLRDYVGECRAAMTQVGNEWNDTVDRIGRWVDMSNPWRTMDKDYMESVWWAFKTLYEKGKIYEGEKVLLYCTKDATPLSKSEVAMDNSYQMDTDPSIFVYFKIEDEDRYLLTWTTTPWTLPANVAVALNTRLKYVEVEYDGKRIVVAEKLYERVFTDEKHKSLNYKVIAMVDPDELVGRKYEPLFENHGPNAHKIWDAAYVSDENGSGLVHLAPAYGEEDFDFAKLNEIPIVSNVDENGNYTSGSWLGENIWDKNKEIAKTLVAEGKALKVEYIEHEYPHCHRCDGKLMYRAHPSWFYDVQTQKDEMLRENHEVNWVPGHLKEGRFQQNFLAAPDWNMSRDRFWATPIPVWKGHRKDGTEVSKVFGSYEEFSEMTGLHLDDYHLPNVIDVEFECDGVTMRHVGKVLDCWFESGSMPFAQFHYPFENKEKFGDNFPGDFITEYIPQTRAWFYYMHVMSVGLFGKKAYKNVIGHGTLAGDDGRKMSKHWGNYTDPTQLYDDISADAWRMSLLISPFTNGEDAVFTDDSVSIVERKLNMFSNTYDFFMMYATVDGWDSDSAYKKGEDGELLAPDSENILDKWIVSRLQSLVKEVSDGMEEYQLNEATRGIIPFLDDLSNWYVRRSRRRFWKSENDGDKSAAYHTLYYVLVEFAKILAPFSPFISEDIYRKLTGEESVHLKDFPLHQPSLVNEKLEKEMKEVRESVREGLAQRARAGIKVRQPLTKVYLENIPSKEMIEVVKEELNVKEVGLGDELSLDLELTPELKKEGLMREVVRVIQSARKNAELNVDDRIKLRLSSDSDTLSNVVAEFKDVIADEVLASAWSDAALSYSETVKIEGEELSLSLEKA
jgi:isoleucyl-tRNA synthetase